MLGTLTPGHVSATASLVMHRVTKTPAHANSHIQLTQSAVVVLDDMWKLAAIKFWTRENTPGHFLSHCRFGWVDAGGHHHGYHQHDQEDGREGEGQCPPMARDVVTQHPKINQGKEKDEKPGQTLEGVPGTGPAVPAGTGNLVSGHTPMIFTIRHAYFSQDGGTSFFTPVGLPDQRKSFDTFNR